jgi:translation initiation factor IF-2
MSEAKLERLSKVAKECNVALKTVVEFLASKGHKVDSNPMTKITAEQHGLIMAEFSSEIKDKENATNITKAKIKREAGEEFAPTIVAEPKKKVEEEEELMIKSNQEQKAKPKKAEPEVVIKAKAEKLDGPKVVSKVNLEKIETPKKATKKKKEEPKEEEEKKTVKKGRKKKTEEAAEEVKAEETGVTPEVVQEEKKEDFIPTSYQKLEGPKILHKIELKEEKKKPAASSNDANDLSKKKRKRIKKSKVDFKDFSNNKPATGNTPFNRDNKFGNKGPRKKEDKPALTEEEVQKQIKETLARLSGGGKSKAAKYRREKREEVRTRMQEEAEQVEAESKNLKVTEFISANQLATMMNLPVTQIISTCMSIGLFVSINQRLDAETISMIAQEYGFSIEFVSAETQESIKEEVDKPEDLVPRPPIITVMGHVDHGKTSLLDYIRSANVVAGEAGGITQHIGAYNVTLESGKKITFLDTPGHEAFTAMRARGAKLTDVVIIVVSADDSVMPQTIEAINHAQAAGAPMVFAINKIDKPGANPDKIREALSQMNILVEEWGGKYQCQEVSAKKGLNINLLLEKVLLEAEMLDMKANPERNASGAVIESSLDKGRGYTANILIQKGTLHVGDIILAGAHSGRVKAMFNERGLPVKEAGPSFPVQILGLNGAPQAGDQINVLDDEREAREIASKRLQLQREQGIRTQRHITLDEIGRRLAIGNFRELKVIIKGDVDGSIEALTDSLLKLSTEKVQVNVIHKSVGAISESDVLLASASDAIIIGFQVRPSSGARKLAETEQIDIRLYSIIYDAINEVKAAMEGMLAPEFHEKVTCNLEIREVFNITKVGTVAGCLVLDGKVTRNTKVRVIRNGIVVFTGELGSLKRHKDDVKEVAAGTECGLNIDKFNDIQVADIIEGYEMVEVKAKL